MPQVKSKYSPKGRPSKTQATKSKKVVRKESSRIPLCFVIMPFGQIGSEKEQHYNIVYEHVIKRAVKQAGFNCLRADEIPNSGPIPERVKEELRNADLVLADLSDRNPNVFYELGFRHALGKPSITISDDVSTLPFNLSNYSTIQLYDLRAGSRRYNQRQHHEICEGAARRYGETKDNLLTGRCVFS